MVASRTILSSLVLCLIGITTVSAAYLKSQKIDLKSLKPSSQEDDILIELDQGLLRGMRLTSRGGRDFLAFMGIPYAQPPIGELRFKPPVKAEPWEGIRNATTLTPQCIQKDKYNPIAVSKGSEDCLHLNVYTPRPLEDLNSSSLPVMFYIHGGGATGNASRYRGDYLMDEDVIFITIHFRLGALGHINTDDSSARGNQAVRDQIMALEWVRDNIKKFGGDPNMVTVFGNSFGGIYTTTHLLSPLSKGLFHQVISQSGTLLTPTVISNDHRAVAFELGRSFNCSTADENSAELISCLRNVDAAELVLASYDLNFPVTVDPPAEDGSGDQVLPGQPLTLVRNGQIHKVPAIFGINSGEGLFTSLMLLLSPEMTESINENWAEVAVDLLMLRPFSSQPEVIADASRDLYLGEKLVSRVTEGNLTDLFTDRTFGHATAVFATFLNEINDATNDVYLYYFDREVPRKYSAALEELYQADYFLGAAHADELQLLFPYDTYPYIGLDSDYFNISRTLVKLWTSFAINGKPSGTATEWLPIEAGSKPAQWYQIDDSPRMTDLLEERMKFWNTFDLDELYTIKTSAPRSFNNFYNNNFL